MGNDVLACWKAFSMNLLGAVLRKDYDAFYKSTCLTLLGT